MLGEGFWQEFNERTQERTWTFMRLEGGKGIGCGKFILDWNPLFCVEGGKGRFYFETPPTPV